MAARGGVMLALLLLGYVLLAARLVQLQYMEHGSFEQVRRGNVQAVCAYQPVRGSILDNEGNLLAASVPVRSLGLDPKTAAAAGVSPETLTKALGEAAQLTPRELQAVYESIESEKQRSRWLAEHPGREAECPVPARRFIWLERHLEDGQYAALREIASDKKLKGVVFPQEYKRSYPRGSLAAHLVGLSDIDGRGLEAAELLCETYLRGLRGSLPAERDARGKLLVDGYDPVAADTSGYSVRLAIDSALQAIAEEELAKTVEQYKGPGTTGCVVVMDPYSGDVLAMANCPTFDPNAPGDSPVRNRLNLCIASEFEPGSTFKPFTMAGALQEKLVSLDEKWDCENGSWRMPNGRVLHDAHGYGLLTTEQVIIKSSNIGIAKVAARLGPEKLRQYVTRFGFGAPTGCGLPGELGGKVRPLRDWTSYSMGSIPMGQEVTVTPLQLAAAYCALANGGVVVRPRVVREIVDASGRAVKRCPVETVREALRPEIAARMRNMLGKVVLEGTGKKALMPEYLIAGKTGTAQLPVNAAEIRAGHKGYSPDRYVSTFVGFAPADVPRLVVLVSIREPLGAHYGGVVAAPPMKEITRRALLYRKVPPAANAVAGDSVATADLAE